MNEKFLKKAKAFIMTFLFAVMLVPAAAFAEENAVLKIPVSVYITGGVDTSEQREYKFEITPEDSAPAPVDPRIVISRLESATADDGTIVYMGKGHFIFELTAFERPGDYSYVIRQITEADEKIKELDVSEYTITIRILNEENGGTYAVWAEKTSDFWNGEDGAKYNIFYENELIPIPKPSGVAGITREPSPSPAPSAGPEKTVTKAPQKTGNEVPPKTGDESQTAFYFSILLASVAVVMIAMKRKNRK